MTIAIGFLVKHPGILSLIQDAGRFGAFNIGLTNGGPIDKSAFHWANRLCANDLDVSTIEVSIGGFSLIGQVDTVISITGANMPLTINGAAKALWRSHKVKAGDLIELGFASAGVRCYVAVVGGFTINESFGSTATVCREQIGGLAGDKLAQGDILACQSASIKGKQNLLLPECFWPSYEQELVLRTIPSYQQHYFSSQQQRLFFSS
ncbi:MAG: allophanate hydrolase, partial [Colwellia sp.]|nr:allophanate hydrolase [Colwellia sp.]